MSDDVKYYCSHCKAETRPQLWPAGVGGECHEAQLLVLDLWEECPEGSFRIKRYRPLNATEEQDLYAALTSDDDRSPHEKARLRSLDR